MKAGKAMKTNASSKKTAVRKIAAGKLRRDIDPGWSWDDRMPYAQGKQVGDTLYVAGQAAIEPDGTLVGKGDMKAQARKTFQNIRTILELAGFKMSDVVKITTFITDISRFGEMLAARAEAFGKHLPASSAVAVAALAQPDLLIEVEAIAVKS